MAVPEKTNKTPNEQKEKHQWSSEREKRERRGETRQRPLLPCVCFHLCFLTEHIEVRRHVGNDERLDERVPELGERVDAAVVGGEAFVRVQPRLQQRLGDTRLELRVLVRMLCAEEVQ